MCASDLKTVLHYDDNLQRIFCAPASGNVSASAGNSATEVLKVGQDAEFSLLQIQKGTMVPRLCVSPEPSNIAHSNTGGGGNSSNGNKITLGQVLPVCTAECAPYNRLTHLTLDMVHQLFMYEKEQLLAYRRRCLPVDVTPSIVVAKNNKSASTCDNSPSQSVWGAKRSTSTTADADTTNTTTTNTAAAAAATVGQSGSTAAGGDVEALPYIQLALERQQQAEVEFQAKLAQRALVTNLMGDHNVGAVSGGTGGGSNGSNSAVGGDVGSSNAAGDNPGVTGGTPASATVVAKQPTDKSIYHLYQHSSGALIFLHPICTKCLLEAHTIDTTAVLPSLNAGRSPAGSPRLKNKKNANAGPPDPADSLAESTAQLSVNNNDSSPHSARTDPTTTVITPEAQVLPTIIHAYKPTVRGKIIDIEVVRVNADIRQRYNALRHLPIHSEVLLLEIDLHSMVPAHVLCKYAEELNKRATKRKERARQEKREKRLDQDRR